jgi:hypothetical protein
MADSSIRESRLRRDCEHRGWELVKFLRSEEDAGGSGEFTIIESVTGAVMARGSPRAFSMTLDDVRNFLAARPKRTQQ